MKVFGYRNRMINSLYLTPVTATVVGSLPVSLPLVFGLLAIIMKIAFLSCSGNLEVAIPAGCFAQVTVAGVLAYAVVAVLHVRRIKRVPR